VTDRKNGRILFDRPKPTVGCSANGRRRYICIYTVNEKCTAKSRADEFTAHTIFVINIGLLKHGFLVTAS
jgi:hypothetical protein